VICGAKYRDNLQHINAHSGNEDDLCLGKPLSDIEGLSSENIQSRKNDAELQWPPTHPNIEDNRGRQLQFHETKHDYV
jgi:predicted lipoprotein